jgi:hypothetical protein
MEFYKNTFGAREEESMRMRTLDGKVGHSEIWMGNAFVMLADESPQMNFCSPQSIGGSPVTLHLYVNDVDEIANRALDCLASNAPKYIKKVGDKNLENPDAVSKMEKRTKYSFKGCKLNPHSPELIHDLAKEISYQESDEIKIDYLIGKFGVEFDKNTVHAVTSFRGRFIHTSMDPENESMEHYPNVLGILERTLLVMLGWKGRPYIDKLLGYRLNTLN